MLGANAIEVGSNACASMLIWAVVVVPAVVSSSALPTTPQPTCVSPQHSNLSFCNTSLPAAQRAALLVGLMTVEELVSQTANDMPAIPRLGVRSYTYGIEALHGVASDCPFPGVRGRCFTSFATSSASAASFNRTLWYSIGRAQAREARWAYLHGFLGGLHLRGPQLNPQRDPRWGRCDNSPGEDAFVHGEYGAQVVLGGQGALPNGTYPFGEARNAIHEMKHFAAYSVEAGRNEKQDTWDISLRDLNEYYFAPLRACIKQAAVGAYMCSYSAINGTASCGNEWMNVDVARAHWGFSGAIESDCGAVEGISSHMHGGWSAATMEVAIIAMNASVSVDCGAGPKNAYTRNLRAAVDQKTVPRAALEAAVARIYTGRIQLGEFDPIGHYDDLPDDTIFSPAHQQLSLESARQSIVLVRNVKAGPAKLPLRPGLHIAVIGPNGNSSHVFQGSYHGANCPADGLSSGAASRDESCLPSLLDEISKLNTGGQTEFVSGCSGPTWAEATGNKANAKRKDNMPGQQRCTSLVNISHVNKTVAASDVVILAIGLALQVTSAEETDRSHTTAGYALPGQQLALAQLVRESGKPVVVIVLSGMAVGMDFIAAQTEWPLLIPGYGGRFGPLAIAEALFGHFSPSGRLPYTVYKEEWAANTPMVDMSLTAGDGRTHRWLGYKNRSVEPSFHFGSGTSYSSFAVVVAPVDNTGDHNSWQDRRFLSAASYTMTTTNTGDLPASEATLIFVAPQIISSAAPQPRPVRTLATFVRTPVLDPGENHTASVELSLDAFAVTDWQGKSVAYSGKYTVIFDNGHGGKLMQQAVLQKDTILDVLPPPRAD